jgi:conjugative transposon TraJ protein
MMLLAIDFDNLHQVLRNLYQEMLPLCGDMTGVAKAVAGLGALFYVAYRVWQALGRAEPIDVFPLLRPFAIGLCIMFFPTLVLGTINAVMSPVVTGAHGILESQITDVHDLQKQKEQLEYDARVREGKAWLVDNEEYDRRMEELGILDATEKLGMWVERGFYDMKMWFRQLIRDFFELLFNAAALTIDTLRTFFLVVLAILGPLSFALSVYDEFQSTLTAWISRYISVYLWLPVADLFSAVLSKIQALMLKTDIALLQDPVIRAGRQQRRVHYFSHHRDYRVFQHSDRSGLDYTGRRRRQLQPQCEYRCYEGSCLGGWRCRSSHRECSG